MKNTVSNITNIGESGGIFVDDTSAQTNGGWGAIYIVTDTVFASSSSNITGLNAFSLLAGQWIYGVFGAFTLTSGSVIAYNRRW